jgi:hypothetical protein
MQYDKIKDDAIIIPNLTQPINKDKVSHKSNKPSIIIDINRWLSSIKIANQIINRREKGSVRIQYQ